MKTASVGSVLVLLAFVPAACPSGPAASLTIRDAGNVSMTVHDIRDEDTFVSSGFALCTNGGGTVTITGVLPSGDHHGLVVTGFETFVATLRDGTIPLGVRGRLSEVTARRGHRTVDDSCSSASGSEVKTWIGWEVSGTPGGPDRAEKFTVTYKDADGRVAAADLRVTIILCTPTETTGICAA